MTILDRIPAEGPHFVPPIRCKQTASGETRRPSAPDIRSAHARSLASPAACFRRPAMLRQRMRSTRTTRTTITSTPNNPPPIYMTEFLSISPWEPRCFALRGAGLGPGPTGSRNTRAMARRAAIASGQGRAPRMLYIVRSAGHGRDGNYAGCRPPASRHRTGADTKARGGRRRRGTGSKDKPGCCAGRSVPSPSPR